jgi:hypothetical protein
MSAPQTASIVLAAASATAVCAAQTPGAAGALIINGGSASGGVATLDAARRILVTTTGADAGKTLVITGTDRGKQPMIETVTLVSVGTVYTAQDFLTVISVVISAAAAAALTVGTNGVASTRWIKLDTNRQVFNASAAVNFGGVTASVTVEATLDPFDKALVDSAPTGNKDSSAAGLTSSTYNPPTPLTVQTGITTDSLVNLTAPVAAVRLTVNSGATSSGVRITTIQMGL